MNTIARFWDDAIVPALLEYIRIPAKSPHFDPGWAQHGHIERAVELAAGWCRRHAVNAMTLEVVRLEGRTPVLYLDAPGAAPGTVLVYGHLDKQPEMTGWRDGLGPWTPVLEDGRLYGRGGADDGYAVFCALAALRSLEAEGRPRPRVAMLIECCEESGSYDLPAYLEALAPRIGTPELVIGLDSGCGNYEQLWGTTSLRGLVNGVLTVEVLSEGVHSGDASGIVASSFRIARMLLDRVDAADTGIVRHAGVPRADPAGPRRRGRARGESDRARGVAQVSVRRGHAPDGGRPRRAGAGAHLAAVPRGDRRRRAAAARRGGQRAAAEDLARALACACRRRSTRRARRSR